MKKLFSVFIFIFAILTFSFNANSFALGAPKNTNFQEFFHSLFGDDISKKACKISDVFVSGSPLGFTLLGDGVVVVGIGDVQSDAGSVAPCDGLDIREGDILISINDIRIDGFKMIESIINADNSIDNSYSLTLLRNKKLINIHVVPAIDINSGKRRLGLWIRDNTAGVGTLTFVTKNNRFGALGHPVCDADTGTFLPVKSGDLFNCNIVGIDKGIKGEAGELRGIFLKSESPIGLVNKNNEFGVYGEIINKDNLYLKKVEVANRNQIKPGKASILTTVYGTEPKEYQIEIIKTSEQSASKSKSMVIKIVDKELLNLTGGIVQGMSGSPILQDGKFVGAVTHVFVSDPTKGFAVYAEWMLEQ